MKTKSFYRLMRAVVLLSLFSPALMLTAQKTIIGTTDIIAMIKNAPGLPATTEQAMLRAGAHPDQPDYHALDNFYGPFEDQVNVRIMEYQAFARQRMEAGGADQAGIERETEAMANQNPIVAGMGGYAKVSQMSEAEAKAAAEQATAQYVADPFAANGIHSAGMTALYRKIVSDPAYAAKFEKMSEAEKEAELRKYMANDQVAAQTPAERQQEQVRRDAQQSQADRIRNAQEILLKISEWQQQLAEVSMDFGQELLDLSRRGNSHEAIAAEAGKRYEAIPMVSLGEYGRDHDPEQVRVLRLQEAKDHRVRAQEELKEQAGILAAAADRYQSIITNYLDYVKANSEKIYAGTTAKDLMEGTNTEQSLIGFESSLMGIALELSSKSRELTKEAAQWEANLVQITQSYR
jgi:hypothetical protein